MGRGLEGGLGPRKGEEFLAELLFSVAKRRF